MTSDIATYIYTKTSDDRIEQTKNIEIDAKVGKKFKKEDKEIEVEVDATIADKSIYLTKGKVLKGLYTGKIGNTSAQCDIVDFKEDGSFNAMFIYKVGMIDDEDVWLEALAERNNVAHAYNRDIALDIVRKTKEQFYDMFGKLLGRLEKV